VIIVLSANLKRDGNKYGLIIITATTEAEMTWLYEFAQFMKYGFISSTSGLRNISLQANGENYYSFKQTVPTV